MLPQRYEFQSEELRSAQAKGRAEGQARSKAEAVIEVLEARGLAVTDDQRERTDLEELRRWVRRAATIARAEELFLE